MTLDDLMKSLSEGAQRDKYRRLGSMQSLRTAAANFAAKSGAIGGGGGGAGGGGGFAGGGKNSIIAEARKEGSSAKGYSWGATGPSYYDCSGLVWSTLRHQGYKGGRFTTSTIDNTNLKRVGNPRRGDIVVWPGHHMGFVTGPNRMYSAKSPSAGIGRNTISGDSSYFGYKPVYYRY